MTGLDWLTARPIAHRGLHDAGKGIIENTPSSVRAAIEGGYGIEVDLQISGDGEAFVNHDDTLGRLTEGTGRLRDLSSAQIGSAKFRATADKAITLKELCTLVGGRTALVLELKSHFDGDPRLPARTVEVLKSYAGPVAVMSFDPHQIEAVRNLAPDLPRGIVAENHFDPEVTPKLARGTSFRLAHLLHFPRTRPHFVAYSVRDLPAAAPLVARYLLGLPLLTWTVRTQADRERANCYASQMIFEGWRPELRTVLRG